VLLVPTLCVCCHLCPTLLRPSTYGLALGVQAAKTDAMVQTEPCQKARGTANKEDGGKSKDAKRKRPKPTVFWWWAGTARLGW